MHIQRPQEWECFEAAFEYALEGGARDLGTGIEPAHEDFAMDLLYFAKAKEDVLRGDRFREGAIAAVVDERDGEFLDAL